MNGCTAHAGCSIAQNSMIRKRALTSKHWSSMTQVGAGSNAAAGLLGGAVVLKAHDASASNECSGCTCGVHLLRAAPGPPAAEGPYRNPPLHLCCATAGADQYSSLPQLQDLRRAYIDMLKSPNFTQARGHVCGLPFGEQWGQLVAGSFRLPWHGMSTRDWPANGAATHHSDPPLSSTSGACAQLGPQLEWLERDFSESKAANVTWQVCGGVVAQVQGWAAHVPALSDATLP